MERKKLQRLSHGTVKVNLDLKLLDIAPKISDTSLYVNPHDEGLSAELCAWRIREPLNTFVLYNFIRRRRKEIDVVLDVGSNIGYFPLIELASGAKQVIAIEPVPDAYLYLKKNLDRFSNAKALNVAVSDKAGKLKMYVTSKLNLATASEEAVLRNIKLSKVAVRKVIEVDSLTLDDVIRSQNLKGKSVLLRMDIEGFEEAVLRNLPSEIYGVSFELHRGILGYERAYSLVKRLKEKANHKIHIVVRELRCSPPIMKWLGFKRTLSLYEEIMGNIRIFNEPNLETVKELLKGEEALHIFTVSKQ